MCKKAKFVDGSHEWGREVSGDCGRVAIKESGVLGLKSSRPQCQTKKFLKIQYSGGCHLENRKKIAISQQRFDQSSRNMARC